MVKRERGKTRAGAETSRRILLEASKLFSIRGYRGTTTRAIAAAVGISQPSLFNHFDSKRAIVEELCRLDVAPSVEGMEALLVEPGSPAAKLHAVIVGEMKRTLESPYELSALIGFEGGADPELAFYRDLVAQFDDLVRMIILAGQQAEEFIAGDPWLAAQMVSGLMARSNRFRLFGEADPSHGELAATYILRALLVDTNDLRRVRKDSAEMLYTYLAATGARSAKDVPDVEAVGSDPTAT